MKIKILQTALLTSIISMGLGIYTANAQSNYELMLVDHYDNGNIQNSNYATNGSRVYGYLYQTPNAERKYKNPYLYTNTESYKIPEWFCMTTEGLPTLLPQTNFEDQRSVIDDGYKVTLYNPITLNNLIDATKEKDHFDLNKVTKVETDDFGNSTFTFEDGQSYINHWNPHIFHYSINGTDWIGYNNRDEVNLPENTCITDFKLPNDTVPEGVILAYNMKVVDIDNLPSPQEGTSDSIVYIYDDEWNPYEIIIPGSPSIPAMFHKLPDIQEVCQEINITTNVEKKVEPPKEEKPTSTPTSNPPVSTPTTPNTSSGPGGYVALTPVKETTPTKPITTADNQNIFKTGNIGGQCVNIVKNLDEPRLVDYYTSTLDIHSGREAHASVSRGEFMKMLFLASGIDISNITLRDVADVDANNPYARYISAGLHYGLVHGQTDGTHLYFRPSDELSRAEAAKIFIRAANLGTSAFTGIFSDVAESLTLSEYIESAYNNCLLHGRKTLNGQPMNGKTRVFEPYSPITIAETAKVLYNMTH